MEFGRWAKNDIIARILEGMKKQKLLRKDNFISFIASISITASLDTNENHP